MYIKILERIILCKLSILEFFIDLGINIDFFFTSFTILSNNSKMANGFVPSAPSPTKALLPPPAANKTGNFF